MSDSTVLMGLFPDVDKTAAALDRLRALGIPEEDLSVLSGLPYSAEILGRPHVKSRLPRISLVSAAAGLLVGIFLAVVTPYLYVIRVGGQPVVPEPPTAIVLYELTMIFLILGTFGGLLFLNRVHERPAEDYYDPDLTAGRVGIVVRCPPGKAETVREFLQAEGAEKVDEAVRRPL